MCLVLFEDGLFLHCREHGIKKVHCLPGKTRTSSSCFTCCSGDDMGVVDSGFVVAGVVVIISSEQTGPLQVVSLVVQVMIWVLSILVL